MNELVVEEEYINKKATKKQDRIENNKKINRESRNIDILDG